MDIAVKAAKKAFEEGPWKRMLPKDRSVLMHKIANKMESNLE